jgi:heme-degrading monooxygenase HmoA
MYMRMVEATVQQHKGFWLEQTYADSILPALEKSDGCIFAGLLKSMDESNRYMSLTLWESGGHSQNYADSGEFRNNLDLIRPLLEESTEWKVQLSRDNNLEYAPVSAEPVIKNYPVVSSEMPVDGVTAGRSYLRVISHKIKPGSEGEFTRIYNTGILPELEAVPGCRYAFLIDNSADENEMLSFSIWDDINAASHYEQEGKFQELLGKVSHILGDLYQWKMALENRSKASAAVTSHDVGISKFTLVTGRKFR